MGIFARCLMIVVGVLLFGFSLNSLAKRKIEASFAVAWGLVSLFLIIASLVLNLGRLPLYMSWTTFIILAIAALFLLLGLYQLTKHVSKLISSNHELATQVSLLLEEERHRLSGQPEMKSTTKGADKADGTDE